MAINPDYNPMNEEIAVKEQTLTDLVMESHKIVNEIEDVLGIVLPKNGQSTEPFGKIALILEAVKTLNSRLIDINRNLRKL